MINNNKNNHRWLELCSLYSELRSEGSEDYFRMGRFTNHLRQSIVESCGCEDGYVTYYSFEHGHIPQYDKCEQVKTSWDSISRTEKGWVSAYGIKLEIAKDTHPKTIMTFPVEVEIEKEFLK